MSNPKQSLRQPLVGVFDSGVGGLTVYREIRTLRPDAEFVYCADNKNLPYGLRSEEDVINLTRSACLRLLKQEHCNVLVIACNTISTLALAALRKEVSIPIVGVVPAIKPASEQSITKTIGLLATPGAVASVYVKDLIAKFAVGCRVVTVGSSRLVMLAEEKARGKKIETGEVAAEIRGLFSGSPESLSERLDTVVLGCTHFPLLSEEIHAASLWPLKLIDSGRAIAARVDVLLGEAGFGKKMEAEAGAKEGSRQASGRVFLTAAGTIVDELRPIFRTFGFEAISELPK